MSIDSKRLDSTLRRPMDWAALAPLLCTAHCLAAPVAAAVLPAVIVGSGAELLLMGATALIAVVVLARGSAAHGRRGVWIPAIVGIVLWGIGALEPVAASGEAVLGVLGGLLLAGGLFWNGRLRHDAICRGCGCGTHS
jgi:hypothetical protein